MAPRLRGVLAPKFSCGTRVVCIVSDESLICESVCLFAHLFAQLLVRHISVRCLSAVVVSRHISLILRRSNVCRAETRPSVSASRYDWGLRKSSSAAAVVVVVVQA